LSQPSPLTLCGQVADEIADVDRVDTVRWRYDRGDVEPVTGCTKVPAGGDHDASWSPATVIRRLGWRMLRPGDRLALCRRHLTVIEYEII